MQSLCPQNQCQAWLFDLVTKPCFEMVMVAIICLNVLCLAVESYDQSMEAEEVLYWLHFSFIFIFLLEFVVKVIALRKYYFKDYWNITDFMIVVTSFVGKFSHLFLIVILVKYQIYRYIFIQYRYFLFKTETKYP